MICVAKEIGLTSFKPAQLGNVDIQKELLRIDEVCITIILYIGGALGHPKAFHETTLSRPEAS